jgi:glyoxylase I family protein
MKLAHIAISVSNLRRSIDFYSKNFGLKCHEKFQIKPLGLEIALLKNANLCLELFYFKKHKPLPTYRKDLASDLKTLGVKHFSFEVADIKRAHLRLKRAKVKLATDIRTFENGKRYFFIKDPDDILVEIMEVK